MHPHSPDEHSPRGLLAFGSSGRWDVSVDDETTSGADRWYLQIEGQSVYLHFGISSRSVVEELLAFLERPEPEPIERSGEIFIGLFSGTPVTLLRDDEFSDRCFLLIGGVPGTSALRITLAGDSLADFSKAIRQVVADLRD